MAPILSSAELTLVQPEHVSRHVVQPRPLSQLGTAIRRMGISTIPLRPRNVVIIQKIDAEVKAMEEESTKPKSVLTAVNGC